jgi:hypothetical protein
MAAKKPFVFKSISYILNKSENDCVRCQEEIIFQQDLKSCRFIPIDIKQHMTKDAQINNNRIMMKNAGENMPK